MATVTRPYIVIDNTTQTERLIQAASQAQARNFVARNQYSVKVATATETVELMSKGVKPEVATDDKAE